MANQWGQLTIFWKLVNILHHSIFYPKYKNNDKNKITLCILYIYKLIQMSKKIQIIIESRMTASYCDSSTIKSDQNSIQCICLQILDCIFVKAVSI